MNKDELDQLNDVVGRVAVDYVKGHVASNPFFCLGQLLDVHDAETGLDRYKAFYTLIKPHFEPVVSEGVRPSQLAELIEYEAMRCSQSNGVEKEEWARRINDTQTEHKQLTGKWYTKVEA